MFCIWYFSHLTHLTIDITDSDIACPSLCLSVHSKKSFYYDHVKFPKECRETYCFEMVSEEFFVVWLSYRLLIIIKPVSVSMSTPLTLSYFHWKFSAQLLCTSWCKNAIQLQSYYRLRLQTHCYLHDLIFFFDIVIPVYCSERVNEEFFVVWLSYRLLIIIKPISVPMSTPLTLSNFHWKFSAQLLCTRWCKNAIQLQCYNHDCTNYRLRLQTHCYLHDLIVLPVYCISWKISSYPIIGAHKK